MAHIRLDSVLLKTGFLKWTTNCKAMGNVKGCKRPFSLRLNADKSVYKLIYKKMVTAIFFNSIG